MQTLPISKVKTLAFAGLLSLLQGCHAPIPHASFVSGDTKHWVALQQKAPAQDSDELLPTIRLQLQDAWTDDGPVLLEGVQTLCGTDVIWKDDANLLLRVPEEHSSSILVHEGQVWKGVTLHVMVHDDQVKMERWSPDGKLRLVDIASCESGSWNIYLRRVGEPTYNNAMKTGWDDPDVFGGFDERQAPLSITWTGPREALVVLPGKRYGVTLREHIGGVTLHWRFLEKYKMPKPTSVSLKALPKNR
jgi:hypothetical protein